MHERTTIHCHLLIWPAVLAATGARKLAALSVLCCVGVTLAAAPPTICAQSSGEAQTVMIPMRDGVELSTALQFPESGRAPFPVVLLRTAYGKRSQRGYGRFFSQHGYVVAIQDVRGTNTSQGEFQIWQHEKEDGYDTVEWLAAQEWSNGKVGMIGGSYGGWVQLAAAAAKPPHLVTIVPRVPMGDPFFNHVYPYGMFALTHLQALSIFQRMAGRPSGRELPNDWRDRLSHLPVVDLYREVLGEENDVWREHLRHAESDSYWEQSNVLRELETVSIPVFLQGGWFDFGGIGTKEAYLHLQESGNRYLKLLIGPWMHSGRLPPGDEYDWGTNAEVDFMPLFLRWFDAWLKGVDDGILEESMVSLFATGPNRWLEAGSYPLPGTSQLALYLTSAGRANTTLGNGGLQFQEQADGPEYDSYVYDPADPTPSLWFDALETYDTTVRSRDDILVYETDPLTDSLLVMGPISARLHASSSAKDTDWVVYWRVIDDQDNPVPMGRGTLRARYRNSPARPELLTEHQIYEYTLDLWHMGMLIEPGWRIRVEIASSCFPAFSRNLNTGGSNEWDTEYVTAQQRIFHSQRYPSHLVLSVIDSMPPR